MERMDLTDFSENELSLNIFNDEFLYGQRKAIYRGLTSKVNPTKTLLDAYFVYTDEQLEVLKEDLKKDLKNGE